MEQNQVVHLTNSEYDAFTIQAKQAGQELEAFIHEVLDDYLARRIKLSIKTNRSRTRRAISELLFEEGLIESIPTGESLSEEEEAELERLGKLFSQGKPLSEMVIEDRGPY